MLDLFRKHATSWFIKVAFGLIVIVFVFWGGYSFKEQRAFQAARVDDHYITKIEVEKAYTNLMENYRRQMGGAFSEDMLRRMNLKDQALDLLINRYVMTKAAKELGLTATTEEIQKRILTDYPMFSQDGKFDHSRYVVMLQQARLSPEAFEQQIADSITADKLEEFVKRRVVVSEEEILADYRYNNSKIQVAYASFEPKSFEEKVTVEDSALQAYYQERQDKYKEPEKRQIAYALLKNEDLGSKIEISEEELKQYYEDNKENFQQEEEIKARHILFSVKQDAPDDEVAKIEAEALKVLDEAKKGADFAELAKKHSKDPGSAVNGGDLGFFTRERMVAPFSEKAFEMKPGEISELVRTEYGFHIIKVEEVHSERTKPFEEVRQQIAGDMKEDRARDLGYAKARELADAAYAHRDLAKAAEKYNLKVASSDAWLGQRDTLPGMDSTPPDIMNKLFTLTEKEVSKELEVPQGFLVAQVIAVQAPRNVPLDNVKDRVTKDYKRDKSRELAQKAASELLNEATAAKSLADAAKAKNMEAKTSEWFSRREPDKSLRLAGDSQNKVFQLDEAKPFPDAPLDSGPNIIVCQLLGKKASNEDLEKERQTIARRITDQKESLLWTSWLEEQKKKSDVEKFKES